MKNRNPLMTAVLCKRYSLFVSAFISIFSMPSSWGFEFDPRALETLDAEAVDLTIFSGDSNTIQGEYELEISVNNQNIVNEQVVHFYTEDGVSKVCFTDELIKELPIRDRYYRSLKGDVIHESQDAQCLDFESLDENLLVDFDSQHQKLEITVPQKFLYDIDDNWVLPRNRDDGVSGLVFDYHLLWGYNRNKYHGRSYSTNSISSYGSLGANIGRFRLRSNYQYYRSNNGFSEFDWTQTYLFTDLPALNAKFYAGELYSRSNLFDNTRFKGVSIYSDEAMMPSFLQGYAPQITGTASSNAIVTVKQRGVVIETLQVPAGPFVISNLPSYITGTVEVEVEESDGSVHSYQVEVASVPFLTRKGSLRFSVNMGRLASLQRTDNVDTGMIMAEGSYGLTSNISLIGGLLYTTNREYRAVNIGLGFNMMQFGALSIDVTQSDSHINSGGKTAQGYSYRFNYAKRFTTSTSLNISGFRNTSRNFRDLQNYLDMKTGSLLNLEKNRISISATQYIAPWDLSISATYMRGRYWNGEKISNYNVSLNKIIREGIMSGSSVNLSFARNRTQYGNSDKSISLYVSIPLDGSKSERVQYNGRYSYDQKLWENQVTYRRQAFGGNYSIGTRILRQHDYSRNTEYNVNASFDRDTNYGRFMTAGSYSNKQQSVTTSFDGSLTLTSHGLATHNRVFEDNARLIVDAGTSGVILKGASSRTNIFGLAGTGIPSYQRMRYMIDNDQVPEDVELLDSVVNIAASEGAIVYRSLGAVTGEKVVTTIHLVDGSYPPFGAAIYQKDDSSREVAIIADEGITYLSGIKKRSEFTVKWGSQSCTIVIGSLEKDALENLTCY